MLRLTDHQPLITYHLSAAGVADKKELAHFLRELD